MYLIVLSTVGEVSDLSYFFLEANICWNDREIQENVICSDPIHLFPTARQRR